MNVFKRLRVEKDLTQKELAIKLGVSKSAVEKWECGQRFPKDAKLIKYCKFFGIGFSELNHRARLKHYDK